MHEYDRLPELVSGELYDMAITWAI